MSILIYLLIFSILPSFSTSSYRYGIIRNASIDFSIEIPANHRYKQEFERCDQCLCDAFRNSIVDIFTCTKTQSTKFICQFYYLMPRVNEIVPSNDTDTYVIKKPNKTFEERSDCCDTAFLAQQITEAIPNKTQTTQIRGRRFRSLAYNKDDNTIITVDSDSKQLIKIYMSNLTDVTLPTKLSLKAAYYYNKTYYLGTEPTSTIEVYDENLTSLSPTINVIDQITTIRTLNGRQFFVGASQSGAFLYEKDDANGIFTSRIVVPNNGNKQFHAIGIVNDSAIYVGWASNDEKIRLYTKDQNNSWKENENDNTNYKEAVSDIFIDNCKRIWAVKADTGRIIIYDKKKADAQTIEVGNYLFNLLILENYTLVTSHDYPSKLTDIIGLTQINPSLNCRPLPL